VNPDEIGVYVHWPFCTRICPYCDFNVYKNKAALGDQLTSAIVNDLSKWRKASGPRKLVSLHFGGGTPSLMSKAQLEDVIKQTKAQWTSGANLEIALEANPGDISEQKFEMWRSVGIERLSIGIQSFDDDVLTFLGRNHDAQTARTALKLAIENMPRVSADIIYGWVGQTKDHLQQELQTALEFGVGHLSAYQLTIEEKTAFAKSEKRGEARAVDVETSANLFELVSAELNNAGFARYEISNFARSPKDRSAHNMIYWNGGDYVGVGPGAHGRLTTGGIRLATLAEKQPRTYIEANAQEVGLIPGTEMNAQDWAEEYVLMGLRIRSGISLARYKEIAATSLDKTIYLPLVKDGLLGLENDRLYATDKGRLVLDAISHELLSR